MPYIADDHLVKQFEVEREKVGKHIEIGKEILWLTQKECIEVGPSIDKTLELTNQALVAHGKKEYEMPAKIGIHPFSDVFFHAMPAYVPHNLACGMKWIECYPQNPTKYNLPQTTGLLVMNDIMTGVPIAVMDCAWITAMRTPAVTVLAAAALHPEAETFGMFGCGVQGIEHVKFVVKTLKKLKKIYVHDIREAATDNLIEAVKGFVGDVEIIKAKNAEEVVKSCEVLSSATIIVLEPQSIVKKEWVSKGQTILPCDLNTFWAPEISLEADKYIVDSIHEHELFAGMGYFPGGLPKIVCETGEVLAGLAKGRETKDELIVCSNIGMSVCDVVMGQYILTQALEKGVGKKIGL